MIDAATFVGWFSADAQARTSRLEYEAGQLSVLVPSSFATDVIGQVANLSWRPERMERLAVLLDDLGFELRDPSRTAIARWVAHGMTPIQAAYAALAEESERPLVAGDPALARLAGRLPRG